MSEYLTISPDGLKLFKFDSAKSSEYKVRKVIDGDDKTYSIIHRQTKKVVASGLTETESDSFYYTETPINFIFNNFRSNVFINEGTTVGTIIDIIESNDLLRDFVEIVFPNYPKVRNSQGRSNFAEVLFLTRSADVEGKNLTVDFDIGYNNGRWFDIETKVLIDQKLHIPGFQAVFVGFSLLDVLHCLFGDNYSHKEVFFKQSGLFDSSGQPIEDPFHYLFADCSVDENTTVLDVFRYNEKYQELKYFFGAYSWCSTVDEFHQLAEKPSENKNDELWFLEVYRHCSVYSKTHRLCFEPHFHGIGELTKIEQQHYADHPEQTAPESSRYSTSWSPINDYAYLPLSLKEDLKIAIYNTHGKATTQKNVIMKYKLIDVLDAIYYDISYLGSPSDIIQLKEEMCGRIEKYKGM